MRKQFAAEATQIAQPAIDEAASRYQALGVPLSGMNRNWTNNGRKIFPFSVNKAVRGLKVRVEGDRRKTGVILLEQRDVAAAVLRVLAVLTPTALVTRWGSCRRVAPASLAHRFTNVKAKLPKRWKKPC